MCRNAGGQRSQFTPTRSRWLTPLHLACKGGYHTCISFLINEETLKAYDYIEDWTPLHYACGYHHIECVRMIVVGFSKLLLQTHTEYNLPFHSLRDQDDRAIPIMACLRNDVQFSKRTFSNLVQIQMYKITMVPHL